MLDWLRLQDQFGAMETRGSRPESRGPALCQEPWTDCGLFKPTIDKPTRPRLRTSIYALGVDATGQ